MDESSRKPAKPVQPRNWVAAGAVSAVALVAVLTAWVTLRPLGDDGRPDHPLEQSVVKAPPVARPDTSVAGGPPAPGSCADCGVVESVAVTEKAKEPRWVGVPDSTPVELRVRPVGKAPEVTAYV